MVRIKSKDLDIAKIADSGQCFRLTPAASGVWQLVARGRVLEIGELPDGAELRCSPREYEAVWRSYFDLDTVYERFRTAVPEEDLFLRSAVRWGEGIRILRQDAWEMLVTFLISQRKNIPAIAGSVERLCRLCGEPLGEGHYAFPTAERVAALSLAELNGCSLGYRSPYVQAAAQLTASGQLDLGALSEADDDALLKALLGVPGVGPKVANCVMLFGFYRLSGFPRDVWINRMIDTEYGGTFPLEPYRGFEGVIQQYIFYYGRSGAYRERRSGGAGCKGT